MASNSAGQLPQADQALLAALRKPKYVRPERRMGKIQFEALAKEAAARTELAPDAPAPRTRELIAELGPEPSEQALDAWEARVKGAPIIDIAHQLDVPIKVAQKLLSEVHEAIREDLKANLELNRSLDLERVDGLISTYYPAAKNGDVDSGRLVLKCLQHRAQLCGNASAKPTAGESPTNVLVWIQNQLPNINRLVDSLPLPET